jgi:DNA-binding phage protein
MRVSEADREILERILNVRRILDLEDVMQLLRSEVKRAGSQRAFARKSGVNVSVVYKTLRRQVLPSEKILRALNLSVVYLSKWPLFSLVQSKSNVKANDQTRENGSPPNP